MSLTHSQQQLINRCNELFNQDVLIDHPHYRTVFNAVLPGKQQRPLVGRVIGWSWEVDEEDEPQLEVRYSSDLPISWANQTDNVLLGQVQPILSVAC